MPSPRRRKPDPVPAVHPVPEYAVEGQTAEWYGEMKSALQVPWMGVVTMAFAHYPTFFAELWRGLGPLVVSRPFVEECQALQVMVEDKVASLAPPPVTARLAEMGYGAREMDQIRAVNAVFSHGNHAYALIATIARLLLQEGEMSGGGEAEPYDGRHVPDVDVPFVLIEAHHADAPTRSTYEDIKLILGLPFVNTDYRAFARWPSYWRAAWSDLREVAGNLPHEALCHAYHDQLVQAAETGLPNPGGLDGKALRDAAEADAGVEEVLEVVRLFQWLLPGLCVNVAYLKSQLEDA
ncbi:MAG: hypothetical protein OXR84_09380 [Magnetovibrio sp.]|nr:hypothetical protein [Magnetovibrio sp.]